MYRVRHLARAHGNSLIALMRMSLALLSNHAISRHAPSEGATKWVGAALRIGPQLTPLQWLKWLLNGVVHQQACRDVLNLV